MELTAYFRTPGEAIDALWPLFLELARARSTGRAGAGCAVRRVNGTRFRRCEPDDPQAIARWSRELGWRIDGGLPEALSAALELYLPLCGQREGRPWVIAQLGQSIDGRIATESGDSYYVSGPEGLTHLHRLRALCDAVLVGANTAAIDNPRLTTRRVTGDNPLRVVLDPHGRLRSDLRLFSDGESPTLVVGCEERPAHLRLQCDYIQVPQREGRLDLEALLDALGERGVHALLVEGGGATVSAFLEAGLLDRLHLVVAPLLIGSGRPGLTLPPVERLSAALRPAVRVYRLGEDILWDFDLRTRPATDRD